MKISVPYPFRSIQPFDDATLARFTVLMGRNGSGKSHLLQGLNSGEIACDLFGSLESQVPDPTDYRLRQPGLPRDNPEVVLIVNGQEQSGKFASTVSEEVSARFNNQRRSSSDRPMAYNFDATLSLFQEPYIKRITELSPALDSETACKALVTDGIKTLDSLHRRSPDAARHIDEVIKRYRADIASKADVNDRFYTLKRDIQSVSSILAKDPYLVIRSDILEMNDRPVFDVFSSTLTHIFFKISRCSNIKCDKSGIG